MTTEGESLASLRRRVRTGADDSLLKARGVHLLTGHVGKGQQFDWVVLIGLEDGCLPDFRSVANPVELTAEACTLSVIVSRARHGVILLSAALVEDGSGRPWRRDESRFLTVIRSAGISLDRDSAVGWLNGADWGVLAQR